MQEDWVKSPSWSVNVEILELREPVFRALHEVVEGNFREVSRPKVRKFRTKVWSKLQRDKASAKSSPKLQRDKGSPKRRPVKSQPFLDTIQHGDCLDLFAGVKKRSVRLIVTSPPYANKLGEHYDTWTPEEYPDKFCERMAKAHEFLLDDGSLIVIIRAHTENERVNPYVRRTIDQMELFLWDLVYEMIWYKPDGPPLGDRHKPRQTWEFVLWFAKKGQKPFRNLKACGNPTKRKGFEGSERIPGRFKGYRKAEPGIARIPDVFTAYVGSIARGIDHPAMYPPSLVEPLILTFSEPGDVVLDPFAGSGTTLLKALELDRHMIGFEKKLEYVELIERRLRDRKLF
jgi:site-specific DNA-methyltransferase (adenine-specific)